MDRVGREKYLGNNIFKENNDRFSEYENLLIKGPTKKGKMLLSIEATDHGWSAVGRSSLATKTHVNSFFLTNCSFAPLFLIYLIEIFCYN
jgi:hypothetical protein